MVRKNNFDFVRLLAATLVIVGHAYPLLGKTGVPVFAGIAVHGLAVKVFFAISGYLVVTSWISDPHPGRFVAKRVLRLFPALIVVVVLSATVLGALVTTLPLGEYYDHPQFDRYFENTFLKIHYSLPGVFADNIYPVAVNGSLWSLPAEAFMYLVVAGAGVVALLVRVVSFRALWTGTSLLVMALFLAVYVYGNPMFKDVVIYATSVMAVLEVAPYFMVGGMIALYRDNIPLRMDLALATLVLCQVVATAHGVLPGVLTKLFPVLGISYAVLAFGNGSLPVLRDVGRIGDISYGVYLWGFPVAQTLSWWKGNDLSLTGHILLTVLVSWGLGYVSWHLIEKRALALKKRFGAPRMPRPGLPEAEIRPL